MAPRVREVRAFNRFYTGAIGVLREGLLRTPYSLTEARVLYELGQGQAEAAELRRRLGIDAGYLSRLLARFESDGLIARERSSADRRRQVVRLTAQGRGAYEILDARSAQEVRALLSPLAEADQRRLVDAMQVVRRVLADAEEAADPEDSETAEAAAEPATYHLRPLRPGDLGWVVQRHGVLYAQEYGWDQTFEALVARIVADYAERRDPSRENAWVAEVGGEPVGCVLCVRNEEHVAQLRLLLVEPAGRGTGVGAALVQECLRFARAAGYREIRLWTNDVLGAARRLYERAGFRLVAQEPHHSFGHDLVGQTWSLRL
jgi:DNA-binding MarR family transcriptional regulator/GNAT superfamily N-acetyltransferase